MVCSVEKGVWIEGGELMQRAEKILQELEVRDTFSSVI